MTPAPPSPRDTLPREHPWREWVASELHARPYGLVSIPAEILHLAVLTDAAAVDDERTRLQALCRQADVDSPAADAIHFVAPLREGRLTWERHSEFSTYTLTRALAVGEPPRPPFAAASMSPPPSWLATLPGQTIAAARLVLLDSRSAQPDGAALAEVFSGRAIVGGFVAGDRARLWTDFHLDGDGFMRLIVADAGLSPRQAGRVVQRLLEIQSYCAMALLGLLAAREIGPAIGRIEQALGSATTDLPRLGSPEEDQALLRRLLALAAETENLVARTSYRFGASRAYAALVARRIEELRERRVEGQQTVDEFLERRFMPAMRTCKATQRRIEALSAHIARASEMLRTRIDVTLESQNRDLLASMNRRSHQQLRLQMTVEGLSVAAITYYGAGLVSYAAGALAALGLPIEKEMAAGLSVPVIAVLVFLGIYRLRRALGRE